MKYVLALASLLTVWPASGFARDTKASFPEVEHLLPADALVYFRYDGYEQHRKAYDRTALGHAMKGDLGEFLEEVCLSLTDTVASSLKDRNPQAVQLLAASRKKLLTYLWRHGLVLCLEMRPLPPSGTNFSLVDLPVRLRLTAIFPEGATASNRAMLLPLLNGLTGTESNPVKKRQWRQRTLHEWVDNDVRAAWWEEDRHLMLVIGNEPVEPALDAVEGRRPNLLASSLFQKVAGFNDYENDIRGFVHLQKLVDLLRTPSANNNLFAMFVDWLTRTVFFQQIGLNGLRSATFHLGFDREYQRSTIVVNVVEPKQRVGLLRLVFAPVQFDPVNLPPLPPDAASVRVSAVDWQTLYKVVRHFGMLQSLQNALSTGVLPKDPLDARNLGVDVPKEILAHLDSTLVLYRSLSEGPFLLGQGIAIKVKDASKLGEGMHKLAKGLAKAAGGLEMQKRTYRGVDMFVWPPSGFPAAPTYAIHQGWLVIGVFPQPVKGFILRAEGKHKVWQPPALVAEALTLAKKKTPPHGKLAAVTVTDPRPSVAVGLSLMPVAVRSWASSFDISKIPNAQAVTDWQLSGVTLFYDDGNALRWESHSSIEAPEEWMLFMFVPQVFR